jgi:hypothetical protein
MIRQREPSVLEQDFLATHGINHRVEGFSFTMIKVGIGALFRCPGVAEVTQNNS